MKYEDALKWSFTLFYMTAMLTASLAIYKYVFEPITSTWNYENWIPIDWVIFGVGTTTYAFFWVVAALAVPKAIMKKLHEEKTYE